MAKSKKTNGYQNFFGLQWYGHVMIPLQHAFEAEDDSLEISEELLLAILQNGEQFSNALKNIPKQASSIQRSLNRAIWNGTIRQSSIYNHNKQFSKSLMLEIRQTGEDTKSIIGTSIASLTKTILLGDSVFYADLIVDIMDRNLYERANDCRWWALTSDFVSIMKKGHLSGDDRAKMSSILKYINDLYTVYTNILIYDHNGIIQAVSNPDKLDLVGSKISKKWVDETLNLQNSSQYSVSNFESSELCDSKHTYIYNAAIKDSQHTLGVKCSKGYREYKSEQDDYTNDIYSLFFSYISECSDTLFKAKDNFTPKEVQFERGEENVDIATFMIADQWLGIDSINVVETLSASELKSTIKIDPNHHFKGTVIYNDKAVMVIDIKKFLQEEHVDEYQEIVILKYAQDQYLGIFVNSLGIIAEVSKSHINHLYNNIIGDGTLIESLVFPIENKEKKDVLSILSIEKITRQLVSTEQSKMYSKQVSL